MKKRSNRILEHSRKELAQGFVEFSLAIPILLLVLYGLLEVGRLLFIYSSTVTAARQAVRYGAVTGVSDGGYPRYQDCAGIRAAAQKVGFIQSFEDIHITFDSGPDENNVVPAPDASCDGVDFLGIDPPSGERLTVSVSTTFVPIVPLVPLDPITIESSSSRTILRDINIDPDADDIGWNGQDHGVYTVKEGDTLESIAANYGIPLEELMTANGLTDTNIFVGQTLIIPSAYLDPTATPTSTNTPTPTATATFTSTPTPKKSPTPSNTPTITFTPTITYTPTITNTPTNTFTPTATGTATYTPSPTATPIECYVSHAGLSITQNKMLLSVRNDSTSPITVASITIFYSASTPAGQGLTAIYADGVLIWDDLQAGSPVTINSSSFSANQPIAPGQSVAFKLFFEKNIQVTGMENIMISFVENGCPIHKTAQ